MGGLEVQVHKDFDSGGLEVGRRVAHKMKIAPKWRIGTEVVIAIA
jgi:hypothetical protein